MNQNKIIAQIIFGVLIILCFLQIIPTPVALVSGFVLAQIFGNPFKEIQGKIVKKLLQASVVGLGFGMNLQYVLEVGKEGLLLTIVSILFTFAIGFLAGKLLKVDSIIRYLISTGTAICGGSAIAAVSPVIKAKEQQISIALGVVFLLNAVALIVFPPIGRWLELTQEQFGLWAAIAIHDTSSVVGAGLAYGADALKVATTVKLSRALFIIPITLISMFLFKGEKGKFKVPMFIILFVLVILLNNWFPIPQNFSNGIVWISKSFLIVVIFMVGAGINIKQIKSAGLKPLSLGVILWLCISIFSLCWILYF